MKLPQNLRLIIVFVFACLLCMVGLQKGPVLAQSQSSNTTDDGLFTVYTEIDVDSNNVISAYASDPELDPEAYDFMEEWWQDSPTTWQLSGNSSDSGDGESFSNGPVTPGSTYTAGFYFNIAYYYFSSGDDGDCEYGALEDGTCEGWDYLYAGASIDVPYPLPQISSLSTYSVNQGDQGTLTITGSNLVEGPGDQLTLNFSGSSSPFTLTGTASSDTATYTYDFSGYQPGSYTLSVTNNEGTSNSETFTVTAPPVEVSSIDPEFANAGDSLTITLNGTGFGLNPTVTTDACCIAIQSQGYYTITIPGATLPTGTIKLAVKIDPAQPAGAVNFNVTNNDPGNGNSDSASFTVLPALPTPPLGPPIDPCAVTSSSQVGFTSMVSTGSTGGSGTLTISFSGAAYAAIAPTVTYGPYSTPSSIAASIAALITKNYYHYGLSARAFGPIVVYNGTTTLGTVSNVASGQSFATDASTSAATEAESSCESAPSAPTPTTPRVTVIAWVNGNAPDLVTLPSGENSTLQSLLNGGPVSCAAQVSSWVLGSPLNLQGPSDVLYANAWIVKNSANMQPPSSIDPALQDGGDYRLFNDFELGSEGVPLVHFAQVGITPDPCKTGMIPGWVAAGQQHPNNGTIDTSPSGEKFQLAEGRIGSIGQRASETINGQTVPWIWSVVEFDQSGNYLVNNVGTFPTYSVYVNGIFQYAIPQSSVEAFTAENGTYQLLPSQIP